MVIYYVNNEIDLSNSFSITFQTYEINSKIKIFNPICIELSSFFRSMGLNKKFSLLFNSNSENYKDVNIKGKENFSLLYVFKLKDPKYLLFYTSKASTSEYSFDNFIEDNKAKLFLVEDKREQFTVDIKEFNIKPNYADKAIKLSAKDKEYLVLGNDEIKLKLVNPKYEEIIVKESSFCYEYKIEFLKELRNQRIEEVEIWKV